MYNVDYFIEKFSKIPEELWCIESFDDEAKRCAFGHCDYYNPSNARYSEEGNALDSVVHAKLKLTLCKPSKFYNEVMNINDGVYKEYQQPTAKQRILAALQDIKKLNGVQECDATMSKKDIDVGKTKTVIKYVSVPETISKSVPETVLS